jgi:hypothetical protein
MSSFAHQSLIRDINTALKPFRSSQSAAYKASPNWHRPAWLKALSAPSTKS